ncbi:thymidine phosphorylase [Paracoccus pacificus]|uniref:Thymidine phosphorylase n=1 Tax=Paracoccus pacificus TaxID=1463598 RepID=A0ABW4RA95_9RHOB
MNDARPIIARLREGRGLDAADAHAIAAGLTDGSLTDAQAGALAMAVLLRGVGPEGRVALTRAMRDSGRVLDWDLPGPVVDKHSTGGIGDCVSLVLAPALAACGAYVPMISGRGLGHTGGTLDKLAAIPGYRTDVDEAEFRRIVAGAGCAIVSASADLAPADRRLYRLRDESGTVESLDLIVASILSKKLAAGVGALVLDVKTGSGAFAATLDQAQALGAALVEVANGAGCPTSAAITAMDQPLAPAAGNAVEVMAAIDTLKGAPGRLRDLTLALGAECLRLAGQGGGDAAIRALTGALDSGAAAERFGRMVAACGGPPDLVERPGAHLPNAPIRLPVVVKGVFRSCDARALGEVVVALGGGRTRAGDAIDPGVGLTEIATLGQTVGPDHPLCVIHAASAAEAEQTRTAILAACEVGTGADSLDPLPLIVEWQRP